MALFPFSGKLPQLLLNADSKSPVLYTVGSCESIVHLIPLALSFYVDFFLVCDPVMGDHGKYVSVIEEK